MKTRHAALAAVSSTKVGLNKFLFLELDLSSNCVIPVSAERNSFLRIRIRGARRYVGE